SRRKHMLARVLLHVVATAFGVDLTMDLRTGRERGDETLVWRLKIVQHGSVGLALGDLDDARILAANHEPPGVEHLATAGGIERSAIEDDRSALAIRRDFDHARVVCKLERVAVVKTVGHESASCQ